MAAAAEGVAVAAGKPVRGITGNTGKGKRGSGIGRQTTGMLCAIETQVFIVAEKPDDRTEEGFFGFTMPPAIRRPIGKLSGPDGRRMIGS